MAKIENRPVRKTKVWEIVLLCIIALPLILMAGASGIALSYICLNICASFKQLSIAPTLCGLIVIVEVFVMIILLIVTITRWHKQVNRYNKEVRMKLNAQMSTQIDSVGGYARDKQPTQRF